MVPILEERQVSVEDKRNKLFELVTDMTPWESQPRSKVLCKYCRRLSFGCVGMIALTPQRTCQLLMIIAKVLDGVKILKIEHFIIFFGNNS